MPAVLFRSKGGSVSSPRWSLGEIIDGRRVRGDAAR